MTKPARTRRYYLPGPGDRTIAALLTLPGQVIAPILAGWNLKRLGLEVCTDNVGVGIDSQPGTLRYLDPAVLRGERASP